ncbi:glycerophosphodiester phosphodiesterase [Actinacidiphila bryophytorum]|uniref:Glycerophosphoryl diester phosphodiesterase n=1 Tax=Actinacidiphila bryophytorum TaxID=1436133 RepID=A0A9W4GY96_9ACTN|nr:glycerophosphodiester phosphodiesterase [Actinacidiphila bryophytorum]MBM9435584.1 glycerophosphodiester phosphodiesterase [Actinacidiphila bryophytorum]MBN6543074.1 glycerophosphodiester phosphodiesterase [Actinacidiphila bryophytorum]CAG7609759.1 Glycerophosphoryl diester phosphodiesterase [Actinacidiphila bryophytorum]
MALTVAHRGDPYVHRENTLPSVRSALLKGADAVEVDVRLTLDGVPVLLHDPSLDRLWGHPQAVAGLTSDEVFKLGGGQLPTLHDALAELLRHARGRMLLDLTGADQAAPSLAAVRDAGAQERVYYCGEATAMRAVRDADPAAEIALTWKTSAWPAPALLAAVAPRWLNLRFGLVDAGTVAYARERGLLVAAWTADWPRSMRRLLALGVDSVTTNRLTALQRLTGPPAA